MIGGLLAAWGGWRLVLVLPAVALLVLIPAASLAPPQRDPGQHLDWLGAVLVTVAGAAVVLLPQAASAGLSQAALAVLAVVGVLPVCIPRA